MKQVVENLEIIEPPNQKFSMSSASNVIIFIQWAKWQIDRIVLKGFVKTQMKLILIL